MRESIILKFSLMLKFIERLYKRSSLQRNNDYWETRILTDDVEIKSTKTKRLSGTLIDQVIKMNRARGLYYDHSSLSKSSSDLFFHLLRKIQILRFSNSFFWHPIILITGRKRLSFNLNDHSRGSELHRSSKICQWEVFTHAVFNITEYWQLEASFHSN